jgi:dienelactone hydrolase
MKRLLWRLLKVMVASIALIVLLLAVTPQGRAAVRTALFVPQVLPAIPFKPQEWVTGDPVLREVQYPRADGQGVADLYLPAGSGRHSAVMFFQGVVPGGRYDPRIVALAEGLARSGMVVMIPWSDTQIEQRIVTEDIDNLVRAFQYLRTVDAVDPDRVGMGGICVGASLAMVAAQDERIRDQVRFVNFFAGYYDAFDLTRAIGSRSRFSDDYVAPWDTDKLTLKVFQYHLIDGVADARDRDLLIRIFYRKEQETEAQAQFLTPEGIAVYRLLNGVPFEEVGGLVELLSPETTEFLRLISPSTHIDQLKARVLIMHDRADRLVPSEESRRLAEALGDESDTYHTEFSFFQKQIQVHVGDAGDVGPLDYAREAFKLFMHMYNIMRTVS